MWGWFMEEKETFILWLLRCPDRSFFLFGPRGTGKSTWLRQVLPNAVWFDLLDTSLRIPPTTASGKDFLSIRELGDLNPWTKEHLMQYFWLLSGRLGKRSLSFHLRGFNRWTTGNRLTSSEFRGVWRSTGRSRCFTLRRRKTGDYFFRFLLSAIGTDKFSSPFSYLLKSFKNSFAFSTSILVNRHDISPPLN